MEKTKDIKICSKAYQPDKVLSALRTMSEEGNDIRKKDRIKQIIAITPQTIWPRKSKESINDSECICQMVNRLNDAEKERLVEILDDGV